MSAQTNRGVWTVAFRRLALAAAMLAGLTVSLVAVSSPASAVEGLRVMHGISATDSVALKTVAIECPPFYNAVGGSAYIAGSSGVRINSAVPSGSGTSGSGFAILASEQEAGTTESWRIVGRAICAPRTSLPGLEYRNAQSSFDSAASHQATATCSPGKKVIGMGGVTWYNNPSDRSQVALSGIYPNSTATQVSVTAYEDETGFAGDWYANATAVCVDPVAGQQPVAAVSVRDTSPSKLVQPQCPVGTEVHSVGFRVSPAAGEGGELHLDELFYSPAQGHLRAFEDDNGAGSWQLRGYAICAS